MTAVTAESRHLPDLLDRAATVMTGVTGVEGIAIFLIDEVSGQPRLAQEKGLEEGVSASLSAAKEALSPLVDSSATFVVGGIGRLLGEDLPDGRERAYAGIPLRARGEPIGLLLALRPGPGEFDADTLGLLIRAAAQLGPAIEAARLSALEQRRTGQLETAGETGRLLADTPSADGLQRTADYLRRRLALDSVAILLAGERDGALELRAGSGSGLELRAGHRVPAESVATWVFANKNMHLVSGAGRESSDRQANKDAGAELALPIQAGGRMLGVLDVRSARADAFDAGDVSTLQTVASQIGFAVENERLVEDTQQALQQTTAIQEVTAAIGGSLDLRATLKRALDSAMTVFGADRAAIFLADPKTGQVDCPASRNLSDEYLTSVHAFYKTQPPLPENLRESIYIEDAATVQTSLAPAIRREGFKSMLLMPLRRGANVFGSFVLYHNSIRRYEANEINLAQTFANQAAIAIDYARLSEDTERFLQRKRGLQEVIAAINASLDLPSTLDRALDAAMGVFKADRAAILLVQDPPRRVICPAARNLSQEYLEAVEEYWNRDQELDFQPDERGMYVHDATAAPLVPDLAGAVRREGFRSQLFLPLRFGSVLRGMFVLYHDTVRLYDEEERSLAQIFADQAAIAIEHARLFEAERQAREQTSAILEATRSVGSSLQLDEVLVKSATCIAAALGQEDCGIWLLDEEQGCLIPRCSTSAGDEVGDFRKLQPIRLGAAPRLRAILQRNQPFLIEDPEDLAEIESLAPVPTKVGPVLVVPLLAYERAVGWVGVPTTKPEHRFDAAAIELAAAIGRSAALAVENARLHEQSKHLAVSEERNRLARELHDSVTQSLFSITLITQALPRMLDSDYQRARERLERLNELARGALAEMRALIFQLRPAAMEDEPLADALRKYAETFQGRENVAVDIEVEGDMRLPGPVEEGVFRIAQEALNNVAKHAKATRVSVKLTLDDDSVALGIIDDGIGFDADSGERGGSSLGITSMRERAAILGGDLSIESSPAGGSSVRVRVPVNR